MRAAVAGCDAVIHTAYVQGEGAWEVNADGSAAVAEAAREPGSCTLSTDLVFDGRRGRYREDDPPAPVNEYGRSKAEAEARVARFIPRRRSSARRCSTAAPSPARRSGSRASTRGSSSTSSARPCTWSTSPQALLELVELDHAGPLHLGGADDVSRFDFAVLLGADAGRLEAAHTTPDRAADVTLDSSRAGALLSTRLRGVREVLGSSS